MIIVTGAAGFIGSCLVRRLNDDGFRELVLVDDFSRNDKVPNLQGKTYLEKVERGQFFEWTSGKEDRIQMIVHLGARTDTTEFDSAIFDTLNLSYSKRIWQICTEHQIPLIYASSAATYGDGTLGFSDSHELVPRLQPLNPYGRSKQDFDLWALEREKKPFFWAGLKFFNVYGPNEYHKGRMASVVLHTFRQIRSKGRMKLFRSHRPDFADGEQSRDFIWVMDVLDVIRFLMDSRRHSGLYNLGSGKARSFNDLAASVFRALDLEPNIEYIDTPADIRDKYQYFTQAEMEKLRKAGYRKKFTPLEDGIEQYVQEFLVAGKTF